MNIQLGDTLTVTFPRDQVYIVIQGLSDLAWKTANPVIMTIMAAAQADHDARQSKPADGATPGG